MSSPPQLTLLMIPRTPIQIAAHLGYLDILQLLLQAFENESQFISEYALALRLAQRAGHEAAAHYLQAYRADTSAHSRCAADEVILMNIEDEREDRRYWYEIWKDERYKTWRSAGWTRYSGIVGPTSVRCMRIKLPTPESSTGGVTRASRTPRSPIQKE